jgi:KUP system potassium uptake protein
VDLSIAARAARRAPRGRSAELALRSEGRLAVSVHDRVGCALMSTIAHASEGQQSSKTWGLMLAALGVVYGDIGTSPLYAVKECFSPESSHHVSPTPENVLGVLSLVFWSMMMVVTVKYLTFITRADNEGAGGILALLALVPSSARKEGGRGFLVLLVLFGAALLYGDGVITPAISVLSAVEGLEIATSTLKPAVVPLTCCVLLALFLVQKRGTAGIGIVFGPVTLVWFFAIALLGAKEILANLRVLRAVSPLYAVSFFVENRGHGFLILGAVVLCITGGEALYADMGHFGRGPIKKTWYAIVWPSLVLNYFGQGAKLLADPSAASNPFYALVPSWALYPTVAVATAATVVASQALISGAFSLTQQAVQLGYFPRVTVVHTSKEEAGQIYIPEVNSGLLVACIVLVLAFQKSSALAAAYGIAVTGTMGITTVVYYVVIRRTWGWSRWKALPLAGLFLSFDLAFFAANSAKFFHGGWVPIAMAAGIFTVMTTWKTGRKHLAAAIQSVILPLDLFLEDVKRMNLHRVRGTAVFMASSPEGTPPILLHHVKHNQVLHEKVVLLSIQALNVPDVPPERRVNVSPRGEGIYQVTACYGFMQTPNAPSVLQACKQHGLDIDLGRTSYYLGRETLLPTGRSKMSHWRKGLFAFISRNARPATAYFGLPPNRVVELGMQVDF